MNSKAAKLTREDMQFDYDKFEKDVYSYVEKYIRIWSTEKKDIYALSINCRTGIDGSITINANTESYYRKKLEDCGKYSLDQKYYYKFYEEEWELWSDWDEQGREIAGYIETYCEYLDKAYDDDVDLYDAKYEELNVKIQELCIRVLKKIKESDVYKLIPGAYFNFYVREKFSEQEMVEIFEKINGKGFCQEYVDHVKSFA